VRLQVWSPLPPSPSGIADYAAEQLPLLAGRAELSVVVEDAEAVDPALRRLHDVRSAHDARDADLDLYQLGNSPAHGFVYRRALLHPGVVLLHDFCLHELVLSETVERGDRAAYLRAMRVAYGETGSFVGRQVARALGGELLPALFPLSEGVLRRSLGVVGLTSLAVSLVKERVPEGRPLLRLRHHLSLPLDPVPSRDEARRALGLPEDALLLTAPGLATAAKRLDVALEVLAALAGRYPKLRLVIAGGVEPGLPLRDWISGAGVGARVIETGRLSLEDFTRHLAAADVLLALRFPHRGEISGALVRGLGVGRPALVSAGSPAADEFPEGVVVPIDPGRHQREQLLAVLERLLGDAGLRRRIEGLAREHVARHHDGAAAALALTAFLETVLRSKDALLAAIRAGEAPAGSLLEYLREELSFGAYQLGLGGFELGADALLAELGRPR
jgi:glycosyltransferase involved in cell wall biosynthesis